jgi:hypothetical protein
VEEVLRNVVGRSINVRVEASPTLPTERLAPTPETPPPPRPKRNPREEVEKLPLIKRALDILGAQIVRADEGFGVEVGEDRERVTVPEGS